MTNNSSGEKKKRQSRKVLYSKEIEKMLDEIAKEIKEEEKREKDDPVYHMQREHERAAKNGVRIDLTEDDFADFAKVRQDYPINSVVEIIPHKPVSMGDLNPKLGTKGTIQGYRIFVPNATPSACGQPFSQPTMLVGVSFPLPFEEESGDIWEKDEDGDGEGTFFVYFDPKLINLVEKASPHSVLYYKNGEPLVDANILWEKSCKTVEGVEFEGRLAFADQPLIDFYSIYPNPMEHLSSLGYMTFDLARQNRIPFEIMTAVRFARYENRQYLYLQKSFFESTNPKDVELRLKFDEYLVLKRD